MVPKRLLRRSDHGPMCAHCAALFAVLDEEQGDGGRPWKGRNKLVKVLGWGRDTVTEHVSHLEAAGLLIVEQVGRTQAVYRVANPSRLVDGTRSSGVDGTRSSEGPEEVHPKPTSGRDEVQRSRSYRSGGGLGPEDGHQECSSENGLEICEKAGCNAPASVDYGGRRWCEICGAL